MSIVQSKYGAQIEVIRSLALRGKGAAEIAQAIGGNCCGVRNFCKKHGIALPGKGYGRTASRGALTVERLRELISYDPETGEMRRIASPGGSKWLKPIAEKPCQEGYLRVAVAGHRYFAHRVAWLYVYGHWPSAAIDHINGVRTDNRIANLRSVSLAENNQNRLTASCSNASGLIGAWFMKAEGCWYSAVTLNRKRHYVGRFKTAQEAHLAYIEAKKRLHPAFAAAELAPTN